MKDYHGREITVEEGPDTEIIVWTIESAFNSDCDYWVVRDYQEAVKCATGIVESLMDDPDIEFPIEIIIGQRKMALGCYEEICAGD